MITYLALLQASKGLAKGELADGVGCHGDGPFLHVHVAQTSQLRFQASYRHLDLLQDNGLNTLQRPLGKLRSEKSAASGVLLDVADGEDVLPSSGEICIETRLWEGGRNFVYLFDDLRVRDRKPLWRHTHDWTFARMSIAACANSDRSLSPYRW